MTNRARTALSDAGIVLEAVCGGALLAGVWDYLVGAHTFWVAAAVEIPAAYMFVVLGWQWVRGFNPYDHLAEKED